MFAQGPRWTTIYSLSADTIFVERLYVMLILLIAPITLP